MMRNGAIESIDSPVRLAIYFRLASLLYFKPGQELIESARLYDKVTRADVAGRAEDFVESLRVAIDVRSQRNSRTGICRARAVDRTEHHRIGRIRRRAGNSYRQTSRDAEDRATRGQRIGSTIAQGGGRVHIDASN